MGIKEHPAWITCGVVAAAVLAWLGPTDLQRRVCLEGHVFGSNISEHACREEFRKIPQGEATDFIDSFLGRAGGAKPREAWDRLSTPTQQRIGEKNFLDDWTPILWAERLGDVQADPGHNRFVVRYKTYGGTSNEAASGGVNDMTVHLQLTRQPDNGIQITDLKDPGRIDGDRQRYVALTVAIRTKTYNLPSATATVAAPKVGKGGLLRGLCQAQRENGDIWVRSPLGWILGTDVNADTSGSLSIPLCDPHHAIAAAKAESVTLQ